MTREDYLKQYIQRVEQIETLKKELTLLNKEYLEEHKQIKKNLPVKIHFVHSMNDKTIEGDGYIVGYKLFNPTSLIESWVGIVYPIINSTKKNGSEMSSREHHYAKYGVFKFWETDSPNTEVPVHIIDFGE